MACGVVWPRSTRIVVGCESVCRCDASRHGSSLLASSPPPALQVARPCGTAMAGGVPLSEVALRRWHQRRRAAACGETRAAWGSDACERFYVGEADDEAGDEADDLIGAYVRNLFSQHWRYQGLVCFANAVLRVINIACVLLCAGVACVWMWVPCVKVEPDYVREAVIEVSPLRSDGSVDQEPQCTQVREE